MNKFIGATLAMTFLLGCSSGEKVQLPNTPEEVLMFNHSAVLNGDIERYKLSVTDGLLEDSKWLNKYTMADLQNLEHKSFTIVKVDTKDLSATINVVGKGGVSFMGGTVLEKGTFNFKKVEGQWKISSVDWE